MERAERAFESVRLRRILELLSPIKTEKPPATKNF